MNALELIHNYRLSIKRQKIDFRPDLPFKQREKYPFDIIDNGSTHWVLTLYTEKWALPNRDTPNNLPKPFYCLLYSQGSAITKPPTLEDVLYCIKSDFDCLEYCSDGIDFCENYGFEDTRQGIELFETIKIQSAMMQKQTNRQFYVDLMSIEEE